MKHLLKVVFILAFFPFSGKAGENRRISRAEYIAMHKDEAIRDMQKTGVPASITLGQACLESDDGNSRLAKDANNHFGIKCSDWTGLQYIQDDDKRDECFRRYNSPLESFDDHSSFLRNRPRYAHLFELQATDYKGWAHGLKHAGYATDPTYAKRLIKIIEENNLYLLDRGEELPLTASTNPAPVISKSNVAVETSSISTVPVQSKEKSKRENQTVYVPPVDAVDLFGTHKVQQLNGIDYVIARKGDSFKSLSKEFDLGYWQLPKYNEMDGSAHLEEGQIVYLKPKKSIGPHEVYIVKDGDTVQSIAHEMGMKSKFLYEYNNLSDGQSLQPGQKLFLKKKS